MSATNPTPLPDPGLLDRIQEAHAIYCELTGQSVHLRCHWQGLV